MPSMFVQLNIIYTFYIKTWLTLFETEIAKQNNWGRLNLMGMGFNQPTNQEKAKKFLEGQLLWGDRLNSMKQSGFWGVEWSKRENFAFLLFLIEIISVLTVPGGGKYMY